MKYILLIVFFSCSISCKQSNQSNVKSISETTLDSFSNIDSRELDVSETPEIVEVVMEEETSKPADENTYIEKPENKKKETEAKGNKELDVKKNNEARPARKPIEENNIVEPVKRDGDPNPEETENEIKEETEVKIVEEEILTSTPMGIHDDWNKMLIQYVSSKGVVNYKSWKKDEARLDAYLKTLKTSPSAAKKNEKLAFLINIYNAYTVKLILDNYPISSIMKIDGGKAWDRKWINLDGKTYSLNDIEHTLIRPVFKDGRIHFAVNCAAKSCPPIYNAAYTKDNVQSVLANQTKKFINGSFNEISPNKLVLSKIFDWYKEDFGDLIAFINRYSSVKVDKNANVTFVDYDWSLNGK